MAAFSLGRAIGSGFALIKHRPASVFVWGLLLVLFVEAPIVVLVGRTATEMAGLWGRTGPVSPEAASSMGFALQERIAVIQLWILPTLLVRALIVAAVCRAVLEPQRRGLAYLRIGRQEGWLVLLSLTVSVLAAMAIVPVELLVGASVALGMMKPPVSLIGLGLGVVALLALLWVVARLSLAAPMTFAERNFRLFESWRLTRRNGLTLLGLGVLMFLLVVVIELVLVGLVALAAVAVLAGRPVDASQIQAWLQAFKIQSPGQMAAWLVPTGLVAAAVFGALNAIAIAPWASAYQQLNTAPRARA
jgi:hypothetical protein